MSNHTASYFHDPDLAIPGHNSSLVYVHQTKVTGLHCEDCGWSGGSFPPGRWKEKHMSDAWAGHVAFVKSGGVLEHGLAANVNGRHLRVRHVLDPRGVLDGAARKRRRDRQDACPSPHRNRRRDQHQPAQPACLRSLRAAGDTDRRSHLAFCSC